MRRRGEGSRPPAAGADERKSDEGLAGASTGGRAFAREDDPRIDVCRRRAADRAIGNERSPSPRSRVQALVLPVY
ncbi:MAG: hypothetical protein JOY58_14830 [Solirubrobacterales bacterium]|nr:hypothetical protein [Solirubrobacterales bacterium]